MKSKIDGLVLAFLIAAISYYVGKIEIEAKVLSGKDIKVEGLTFKCENYYPKKRL